MILPIDVEKVDNKKFNIYDKILINKSKKIKLIEGIYKISTDVITQNGKILKAFSLRQEMRQGCPLLPVLVKMVLDILVPHGRKKKQNI